MLSSQISGLLNAVPALVENVFPMPGRFRSALPAQIAELSRLLTGGKGERKLSYLSRPNMLAAYLRYFLPWNLFRLCIILPDLDLNLAAGSVISDLGCGPLTFASALWISRPDLRSVPLEFYCVDRCAPILEAGKKFFLALVSSGCPWKIHPVKESINITRINAISKGKPASLVCAVNLLNELYENSHNKRMDNQNAANAVSLLKSYASPKASYLIMEPGIPQSGHFISRLRSGFLLTDIKPLSPCTHHENCPFDGKKRWCHFAFETDEAPRELHRLSAAAGIPKERLVFSYLFAGSETHHSENNKKTKRLSGNEGRVISDAFPLPDKQFGRYVCCVRGLALLTGEKHHIEKISSWELINLVFDGQRDEKSGALLARQALLAKQVQLVKQARLARLP
jgi:hypothetical protein